jgi:hypothetical protein
VFELGRRFKSSATAGPTALCVAACSVAGVARTTLAAARSECMSLGDGEPDTGYRSERCCRRRSGGVDDVCIVVCDGLKGLPESIEATWPLALVQTCVLHLCATLFGLPAELTGTRWPATSAPSTPR